MKLKALNHWDFFKIILVVEYALTVVMMPFLILVYFYAKTYAPTAITINGVPQSLDGTNPFQLIEALPVLALGFFVSLIFAAFKAWVLMLLCRYTPLGNIQIGNTHFGRPSRTQSEFKAAR